MDEEKIVNGESMPENKPKPKMAKWVIALIVLACLYYIVPIGLFVFAIVSDNFTTEYKVLDDGSISINNNKLTIKSGVKGYYNEEKGAYYIEGKVTNNTDKDYDGVEIRYYVYNENDEVLGEASNFIQKLGPKKTWNFKVIYDEFDANTITKFEYNPSY